MPYPKIEEIREMDPTVRAPFVGERVRVTLRQPCGQHGEEWHGSDGVVYARNLTSAADDHPYLVMHEGTLSNGLRGAWAEWFAAGELVPL